MLWVGHFKTISGHFSTNYIKNFYKSKLLTNILRCQTYLNLNWMIIYDINTIFSESLDFQFWKKISWKFITGKWPFFHCFWSFFANFMSIFHETEVQTVILRCLVSLNLNGIKSYYIILAKNIFLDAWKCIISRIFRRNEFWDLRRKSAFICSKWLFWQNSLMISWTT